MSVLLEFALSCAFVGLAFLGGFKIISRTRSQNLTYYPDDDLIFIALCETRTGIKTHYHIVEDYELNYTGYPTKDHSTLCGAEVGWDMRNQDAEATCETCREALENLIEKYGDRVRFVIV